MIYLDKDTQTLVALTLAGDQSAYETLVLRYQTAVIASACAVTRNEYMAEDAAQDAFVSAWLKLSSLREAEKFGAWVCRIAKNCAKNIMTRYREYVSFDDIANTEYETGECVEELVLQVSDDESLVEQSISRLSETVRKIIKLHYFDGYSVSEIANMLIIPVGTVKYQLHEGRKKMRKELCAMNEHMNDTLVQRVMKKVEEFKLWAFRNKKEGIEEKYEKLLAEIEGLPDSKEKQGMLADMLMREILVDLFLAVQRQFVLHSETRQRIAGFITVREQFGGRFERIRHAHFVGSILTKVFFIDDKTAADGIISFAVDDFIAVIGVDLHTVFMQRQVAVMKTHPVVAREIHFMPSLCQQQTFALFYVANKTGNTVDIHGGRFVTCKTHNNGDIGVVAFTRQRQ